MEIKGPTEPSDGGHRWLVSVKSWHQMQLMLRSQQGERPQCSSVSGSSFITRQRTRDRWESAIPHCHRKVSLFLCRRDSTACAGEHLVLSLFSLPWREHPDVCWRRVVDSRFYDDPTNRKDSHDSLLLDSTMTAQITMKDQSTPLWSARQRSFTNCCFFWRELFVVNTFSGTLDLVNL